MVCNRQDNPEVPLAWRSISKIGIHHILKEPKCQGLMLLYIHGGLAFQMFASFGEGPSVSRRLLHSCG